MCLLRIPVVSALELEDHIEQRAFDSNENDQPSPENNPEDEQLVFRDRTQGVESRLRMIWRNYITARKQSG